MIPHAKASRAIYIPSADKGGRCIRDQYSPANRIAAAQYAYIDGDGIAFGNLSLGNILEGFDGTYLTTRRWSLVSLRRRVRVPRLKKGYIYTQCVWRSCARVQHDLPFTRVNRFRQDHFHESHPYIYVKEWERSQKKMSTTRGIIECRTGHNCGLSINHKSSKELISDCFC